MSKVIIIGSGPAGISAALYTVRAGFDTTIITKGQGSLQKAESIENYYGFSEAISGAELEARGIEGAKKLGVSFITAEVTGLTYFDNFIVETNRGDYHADSIIIATGSSRNAPKIKGISEFEGRGVSYCAICDAFAYRGKNVTVIGNGAYALHEIASLRDVVKSITLLTDGTKLTVKTPENVKVIDKKISLIGGNERVSFVEFEDGEKLNCSGVFIAIGTAGSTELARKIGAVTENNKIVVNEKSATSIDGLFAAGDCVGGLMQVSKSVYEGAVAGIEAAKFLRNKKNP